jgi:hypothetical protein
MDKYVVLVGEIVLDQEPKVAIYAESDTPISKYGVADLKDKLSLLLARRFLAAPPELSKQRKV